VERNSGSSRSQTPGANQDRKSELVEIAYRLIGDNGLEGFRIRKVAAAASMDNGTLHYYFP